MNTNLGKWALIDIETTGIDQSYDKIIDLGFLQFEGTKLVKKYSSLIQCEIPLSKFITKLTGITDDMVKNAPAWPKVEADLLELEGHALLAHNAAFEEKFLGKYFEANAGEAETYQDSMLFLSLLFPNYSSLKLENFILDFGISEKEEHRGYADSLDLLKVILMAVHMSYRDLEYRLFLQEKLSVFSTEEFWYKEFFNLSQEELLEIADQIEFDLDGHCDRYFEKLIKTAHVEENDFDFSPSLEFSGKNINNILKDENSIQQVLPKYKFREAQAALSLKTGQSFQNGIHSLIQAPTGTGKTLGYLIPSFLYAHNTKRQVLISTGTKTLQNQALNKDVPQVYKILGLKEDELKVTRLVGSGNHFCELMYRKEQDDEMLLDVRPFSEKYAHTFFDNIFFHNQRTSHESIITKDDLPYALKRGNDVIADLEGKIKVDYRSCTGQNCPFKGSCTYMNGLRRAKEADVIIGNHALSLMWTKSFERPLQIVMDEAHKLEGEATKIFSKVLSEKELENIAANTMQLIGPLFYLLGQEEEDQTNKVQRLRKEVMSISEMLKDHLVPLRDNIEQFFKKMPRYTDVYWNELPMIKKESLNDSLSTIIFNHTESLKFIMDNLYTQMAPFNGRWEANEIKDDKNKITALTAFESAFAQVEDILSVLNHMTEGGENFTNSIRFHEEYGYTFEAAPIDIGKIIHQEILDPSESVVFTSATLANSTGTQGMAAVEWMTGYSYLPSEKRFKSGLFLDEVYDYKNNAKVYLSTDVPKLYESHFVGDVLDEVTKLIKELNGRTLLLFSAKVRFEKAREYLLETFEGVLPVFVQGMGANVVEEFKNSEHGILLGMESFGEGIDIPGDSLQLVYVDKVPDLRQDLVIQDRRDFFQRQFGNEFNDYFLAHRTRSLHQKLGRLIRTDSDRGGIIITDARVGRWKKGTLDTFKKLMEPYDLQFAPLKESIEGIQSFIQQ